MFRGFASTKAWSYYYAKKGLLNREEKWDLTTNFDFLFSKIQIFDQKYLLKENKFNNKQKGVLRMDEVMYLEDLPAFKHAPSYARKFSEELLTFQQEEIVVDLDGHKFYGFWCKNI